MPTSGAARRRVRARCVGLPRARPLPPGAWLIKLTTLSPDSAARTSRLPTSVLLPRGSDAGRSEAEDVNPV